LNVSAQHRHHAVQHVGIDLVAAHHGVARRGTVHAVPEMLGHRRENPVGLLDLPQQAGIAAGAEQERH
jgi:hypothetical protein